MKILIVGLVDLVFRNMYLIQALRRFASATIFSIVRTYGQVLVTSSKEMYDETRDIRGGHGYGTR